LFEIPEARGIHVSFLRQSFQSISKIPPPAHWKAGLGPKGACSHADGERRKFFFPLWFAVAGSCNTPSQLVPSDSPCSRRKCPPFSFGNRPCRRGSPPVPGCGFFPRPGNSSKFSVNTIWFFFFATGGKKLKRAFCTIAGRDLCSTMLDFGRPSKSAGGAGGENRKNSPI